MTGCPNDYTAHYRWEWFRREQWERSFREGKRHSSGALIELVKERGMQAAPVLDCSCGLGLKTLVMKEAGLDVQGSDQCGLAVECARLLAEAQGHTAIVYFVSSWAELPRNTATRYGAIFNDALSWVYHDEEMAASLRGLHECLVPGGILTYMGALPGTDTNQKELLEREWEKKTASGRHRLGRYASKGKTSVQEIVFVEKGLDFIDEHHLYVVDEDGTRRVEIWCVRCPTKWSWPKILPFLEEAGFSAFGTKEFIAADAKPFHLVVAQRD